MTMFFIIAVRTVAEIHTKPQFLTLRSNIRLAMSGCIILLSSSSSRLMVLRDNRSSSLTGNTGLARLKEDSKKKTGSISPMAFTQHLASCFSGWTQREESHNRIDRRLKLDRRASNHAVGC